MRKIIVCLLAIITAATARAGEAYNINSGWRFYCRSEAVSDHATTVDLPHTWNADDAGPNRDYFRGTGNYLKDIEIPATWDGRRVFLRFGGAGSALTLIVGGRFVGEHLGGYTAATFEITPFVTFGAKNAVWAIVNNSPRTDVMPAAGEMNAYGGLFRNVELITTPRTAIALTDHSSPGIYVASRKTGEGAWIVETTVKISSPDDKTVQATVRLVGADGQTAAEGSEQVKVNEKALAALTVPLTLQTPRLWGGTADPHMYRVEVRLTVDDAPGDSAVVRTGLRDCGYDPARGFLLNGRLYPLRGVTVTQDRMDVGTALTPWQLERDVKLIRELGANFVCVSPGAHSEAFYHLCDQEGLMVMNCLPFTGETYTSDRAFFNTPAFKNNGKTHLTEMIRQGFNHPSIIMWGLFSGLAQRGDDPTAYIKELNALAKKEDPGRLTACRSNQDGELNFITDMVLWQHRYGWNEGTPADMGVWLTHLHKSWGNLHSAVSYGAGGSPRDQADSLRRPMAYEVQHPERWQTYVHEQTYRIVKDDKALWCVMLDNMFDYGASGRNRGRGPGIDDLGLVTFDRSLRKDAYWFYKANWNDSDPFIQIAESRWIRRRGTTQTLRVFSNCPEVELLLGGRSLGIKQGVDGVFTWPDVAMVRGLNEIEARSGALRQQMSLFISPEVL